MIKVLTVFGTRPEAIKMAPLVKGLDSNPKFQSKVCVTAQHREMLDQVLSLFEITPDIDLDIMRPNQDLFELSSNVLLSIRDVFKSLRPDLVLVQGDTTTTFISALGAFYEGIPVGHVEAGLRTGNLKAPFPEEANRKLTTILTSLHFCPTKRNVENLILEGINRSSIWVTGNTVIDALIWVQKKVKRLPAETWINVWGTASEIIEKEASIILMTGHRRENFGRGFKNICGAVNKLASMHKDWHFIYPVHLNPNVSGPVNSMLGGLSNVHLIEPLDYAPFVFLMDRAKIILTDSGGVQEEAPSLGKPVLVMREVTERQEGVDSGTVKLVGTDSEKIIESVETLMKNDAAYCSMSQAINPYGDGRSASRIIDVILEWDKKRKRGESDGLRLHS